jgi:hypothetical protein
MKYENMNILSLVHFESGGTPIMYGKNPDRYIYRQDSYAGAELTRDDGSTSNKGSYGDTGDGVLIHSVWQWEVLYGPDESSAEAAMEPIL